MISISLVISNPGLVTVWETAREKFELENGIIAGDLNAEGSYVSQTNLKKLKLRSDSRFTWQIGDECDTTVGNSNCAYDRIITTGKCTEIAQNGGVFKFDDEFQLTRENALKISDHYPVTVDLLF